MIMNYGFQLLSGINQIYKSYEVFNPVLSPEKAETIDNHIRITINPDKNPFVAPSMLKSFSVNYIRDEMVSPENYNAAAETIQIGSLLATPETAFFIYKSTKASASNSADFITTPLSSGNFSLMINKLAQNQLNYGAEVNPTQASGINDGIYAYNITINGVTNLISTQLDGTETNEEVLSKIASSINSSDIGITATVNSAESNGSIKKYLALYSQQNGKAGAFTINDVVGSLQSVYMPNDENNVITEAQNAEIFVNGNLVVSDSNEIFLPEYNMTVNLKQEDSENKFISITKNTEIISDTISAYVGKISQLLANIKKSSGTHSANTIDNFKSGLKSLEGALKEIGITVDFKNMSMKVDTEKLQSSIKSNSDFVQNTISGSSGLARFVNNTLNEYLQTPIDLFSVPRSDYNSYSYMPIGYNSYNPYDVRGTLLKL